MSIFLIFVISEGDATTLLYHHGTSPRCHGLPGARPWAPTCTIRHVLYWLRYLLVHTFINDDDDREREQMNQSIIVAHEMTG